MSRPGIQSTASPGQASIFLSTQNALAKLKKKRQKALLSIDEVPERLEGGVRLRYAAIGTGGHHIIHAVLPLHGL